MAYTQQINPNNKKIMISNILATAAMALLLTDTTDTFIAQGRQGLLPLNDQQRGISLGVSSIILFFLSFELGFGQRTRLTTLLFIAGGALLVSSKLVEPRIGLNLFLVVALPYAYMSLIAIGFILVGLGLLSGKETMTDRIPNNRSSRHHLYVTIAILDQRRYFKTA